MNLPDRTLAEALANLGGAIAESGATVTHDSLSVVRAHGTAAVVIGGIELAWKIRKHQFRLGKLPGRPTAVPAIWAAVIAA